MALPLHSLGESFAAQSRLHRHGAKHFHDVNHLIRPFIGTGGLHQPAVIKGKRNPSCAVRAVVEAGDANLTQLISDVLNDHQKSSQKTAVTLLQQLDALGGGVTTTVTREWWGPDARLEVTGSWEGGLEARQMAMLAVHQERIWCEGQLLHRVFELVDQHRPGLMPEEVVQRVRDAVAVNAVNGATAALGAPELLLLAAAVLQAQQLEAAVEEAVQQGWRRAEAMAARSKRGASVLSRAQAQLARLRAAMRRSTALARLRLNNTRHMQRMVAIFGELVRSKQQQERQQQEGREGHEGEEAPPFEEAKMSPDEQAALFFEGRMKTYRREGLTGPGCGRMGLVSFGRTGRSGLARNALLGERGGQGTASFGAEELLEYTQLAEVMEASGLANGQQQAEQGDPGLSAEVTRAHRNALIRLLCAWAEASGAVQLPAVHPERCTQSTLFISGSPDHASRRVLITVEGGRELALLRQAARAKRDAFLGAFGPLGSPFGSRPDWEYVQEAANAWHKCVELPASSASVRLRLTTQPSSQQQQAAAASGVPAPQAVQAAQAVQLQARELQALVAALLELIPAAGVRGGRSSNGRYLQPGPWVGPPSLQLRFNPGARGTLAAAGVAGAVASPATGPGSVALGRGGSSSSSSSASRASMMAGASGAASLYEARWLASPSSVAAPAAASGHTSGASSGHALTGGGQTSAPLVKAWATMRLTASHIQSLVNVLEDLSLSCPGLLDHPQRPPLTSSDADAATPSSTAPTAGGYSTGSPSRGLYQPPGAMHSLRLFGAAAAKLLLMGALALAPVAALMRFQGPGQSQSQGGLVTAGHGAPRAEVYRGQSHDVDGGSSGSHGLGLGQNQQGQGQEGGEQHASTLDSGRAIRLEAKVGSGGEGTGTGRGVGSFQEALRAVAEQLVELAKQQQQQQQQQGQSQGQQAGSASTSTPQAIAATARVTVTASEDKPAVGELATATIEAEGRAR